MWVTEPSILVIINEVEMKTILFFLALLSKNVTEERPKKPLFLYTIHYQSSSSNPRKLRLRFVPSVKRSF